MNVKPSLFKNEKTEVERGIVPQSCLISDGVRIRTQLPDLNPELILTPCSLPSSDKEDEDKLGRVGKGLVLLDLASTLAIGTLPYMGDSLSS